MLDKKEFKEEEKYLHFTQNLIDERFKNLDKKIEQTQQTHDEVSRFVALSFYEMDDTERAVQREMMEKLQLDSLELRKQHYKLSRQQQSPYFGRIDFTAADDKNDYQLYIGINQLLNEDQTYPVVLDWRAPICSMYYEFETGEAEYNAPIGVISGEITLKRQYKTQHRELVYAFNSSLTIGDEILRQTLGKNAESKMQNIVSTIQREQNKIIRSDETKNLIIQGVAGSGKTSIALHRVAYLLYNSHYRPSDIMIVSPSALFSDYISNVLPELNEDDTPKTTFEEIARRELDEIELFESRAEMIERILQEHDDVKGIKEKSSFEFVEKIEKYCKTQLSASFHAKDIKLGKKIFTANTISMLYHERYKTQKPSNRIDWISDYIVEELGLDGKHRNELFLRIRDILFSMFAEKSVITIYADFLKKEGLGMKILEGGRKLAFEDIAGLLYIKNQLKGIKTNAGIKHVVIDEMQDYSPLALEILDVVFPCRKTILGDVNQCIERDLQQDYLDRLKTFIPESKLIRLNTSYRSTIQIAKFANEIKELQSVKNFNRNGEEVSILQKKNLAEIVGGVQSYIQSLKKKNYKIAILTPDLTLAKEIHDLLKSEEVELIDKPQTVAYQDVVIMSTALSKGLEFDSVILVDKKGKLQNEQVGKIYNSLKYVGATRALHKLICIEIEI